MKHVPKRQRAAHLSIKIGRLRSGLNKVPQFGVAASCFTTPRNCWVYGNRYLEYVINGEKTTHNLEGTTFGTHPYQFRLHVLQFLRFPEFFNLQLEVPRECITLLTQPCEVCSKLTRSHRKQAENRLHWNQKEIIVLTTWLVDFSANTFFEMPSATSIDLLPAPFRNISSIIDHCDGRRDRTAWHAALDCCPSCFPNGWTARRARRPRDHAVRMGTLPCLCGRNG